MVWIFPTCARFLNDFGAFWLHSAAAPPPPPRGPSSAGMGRAGPARTGRLAGWVAPGWLAGSRVCCVLCVVIVCVRARARASVVCCVLQGSRGTRKEDSQTALSAPLGFARSLRTLRRQLGMTLLR